MSPRYGTDFVGGAEASLRTMARALRDEGLNVEVFTTCNRHDWQWANHHPAGTSTIDGIAVHRFPIDPHDRELHLAALDAIRRGNGVVSDVDEAAYLTNSLRSTALVEALAKREREFDAIIAGPYLFGLTWEIARRFNSQVLLAPCFHDEPIARLRRFRQTYAAVGGILYHSPEEQALAERTLGINHPYASVVGTSLDLPKATATLRAPAQPEPPYVVYCGRYSPEKGINTLLEFATRYSTDQPNRFRFVLMGEGRIESPDAPWLVNKGFVPDSVKREVMANARALIQLSTNESLSLVTLEAWAAGIPVIGHRDCAAVRGLVERSGGGAVIGDYAEFAKMMDDLWDYSDRWREAGAAGQRYVLKNYASRPAFAGRLQAAIAALGTPLAEQMRRKGLARAQQFGYSEWEKAFGELLARTLQGDEPSGRLELEVTPLVQNKTARPNDRTAVVPVRLTNHGTLPAAAKGPARIELGYRIAGPRGKAVAIAPLQVPLPNLLTPGQSLVTAVPVAVPAKPGRYCVTFLASQPLRRKNKAVPGNCGEMELVVAVDAQETHIHSAAAPLVSGAQQTLAEAVAVKNLPTDYADVTQGFLAKWKRLVKQKLLNNFRRGYVDVLARQQSAFNEKVLTTLCQLIDSLQIASHAGGAGSAGEVAELRRDLRQLRRHCRQLERRLAAVEQSKASADAPVRPAGVNYKEALT